MRKSLKFKLLFTENALIIIQNICKHAWDLGRFKVNNDFIFSLFLILSYRMTNVYILQNSDALLLWCFFVLLELDTEGWNKWQNFIFGWTILCSLWRSGHTSANSGIIQHVIHKTSIYRQIYAFEQYQLLFFIQSASWASRPCVSSAYIRFTLTAEVAPFHQVLIAFFLLLFRKFISSETPGEAEPLYISHVGFIITVWRPSWFW